MIGPSVEFARRLDRFDPSRSDRPAGISVRRPWWSVRKASKMRSDHLEVLVCSQQGKVIFATGDRNQDVVDQRAWPIRGAQPGYIPTQPPLAKARELVQLGQSDPGLDQVKEDAQSYERRQADDLLTRTQSDQGQHATDADGGRSSEEAEVQRRAGQLYASASKHPRRCAPGAVSAAMASVESTTSTAKVPVSASPMA